MEYHGDEDECQGFCGICEDCIIELEQKGDDEYEKEKQKELDKE